MRLIPLVALTATLHAWPILAFAQTAEGDVAAFLRLRQEGAVAFQAGDLSTARERFEQAARRNPGHPGLTLMRARVAMAQGRVQYAADLVFRYASYGFSYDLARDPILAPLIGTPELAEARVLLTRSSEPAGADRLFAFAEVDGNGLAEAIVRDRERQRWLVSQVRGRTIVALSDSGEVAPFLETPRTEGSVLGGVSGLAWSPDSRVLWATTAPLPPALSALGENEPVPAPALLEIDPATGRILHRYEIPGSGERSPGDLAVGQDGTVFVSDSASGAIYRLAQGQGEVAILIASGTVNSPQGLAVSPDGSSLIVADYTSGLWRIDLIDGTSQHLSSSDLASLIGVDGLIADGDHLFAVQNGTRPQRVLQIDLNPEWTQITAVKVLAANLPALDEPTTGITLDDKLVLVGRSQWSDFDSEGVPQADMLPARLVWLDLD